MSKEERNLVKLMIILFIMLAISVLTEAQIYEADYRDGMITMYESPTYSVDKYKVEVYSTLDAASTSYLTGTWFYSRHTDPEHGRKYQLPLQLSCYPGTYYVKILYNKIGSNKYKEILTIPICVD